MSQLFFQDYHKEYIFKIMNQKLITLLCWSSWKSNKNLFFEYFPWPKVAHCHSLWVLIFISKKACLFYVCLTCRVQQTDFKWCKIMYAKSATHVYAQCFNQLWHKQFWGFCKTCDLKCLSLLCFIRNQENG